MDFLSFFSIVEQDRDILNPISPEKLWRVAQYAGLRDGMTVLDIGSGKGALLRQWAGRWDIRGTGLELNPTFVADADALAKAEGTDDRLTFREGPALDFPVDPAGYDVVTCLGAPFAIGSFQEAVQWMVGHTKPGGAVIIGDVYLRKPAPAEAAQAYWATLPSLQEMTAEVERAGLELIGLTVSDEADWDHYSSLMWSAVHRWATENPDHPDRAEVLEKTRKGREKYLRWEREHLGWAVWVGRV